MSEGKHDSRVKAGRGGWGGGERAKGKGLERGESFLLLSYHARDIGMLLRAMLTRAATKRCTSRRVLLVCGSCWVALYRVDLVVGDIAGCLLPFADLTEECAHDTS